MCNFLIQKLWNDPQVLITFSSLGQTMADWVPPQDSKTAHLETLTDTGPGPHQLRRSHSKYDSPLCFGKVGLPPGTFFNELHRKKCMHVVKGSHT